MTTATRSTKSFSLDPEVFEEVHRTKGSESTSERVNQLLKLGLEVERQRSLANEAAAFFSTGHGQRPVEEHDAFQQAGIATMVRNAS
jgi:hypothetical protein